jgi:hypothetical protein
VGTKQRVARLEARVGCSRPSEVIWRLCAEQVAAEEGVDADELFRVGRRANRMWEAAQRAGRGAVTFAECVAQLAAEEGIELGQS